MIGMSLLNFPFIIFKYGQEGNILRFDITRHMYSYLILTESMIQPEFLSIENHLDFLTKRKLGQDSAFFAFIMTDYEQLSSPLLA